MRERGGSWAVFRNEAMDSSGYGHEQFIKYGEGCTYEKIPERCPDTSYGAGWKYVLRGTVNLATGEISPAQKQ